MPFVVVPESCSLEVGAVHCDSPGESDSVGRKICDINVSIFGSCEVCTFNPLICVRTVISPLSDCAINSLTLALPNDGLANSYDSFARAHSGVISPPATSPTASSFFPNA